MSRKSNLKRFNSIVAGDMSASITGPVSNIEFLDNIGVQFNFTGSPVGNFQIQVSLDYDQDNNGNVINPGNWVAILLQPANSINAPTSLGSPIIVDLNQLSAPWVRLVYNRTSGTGAANAFISAKMI